MVFVVGSAIAQEVNSSVPLSEPSFGEDGNAQQVVDYTPSISIDSRFGYDRVVSGGPAGFGGDGLYLNIDGKISKNLSYSLCQRFFSSQGDDDSAFDNTDWLTLSYEVGSFSFTAGKDVVMVGSFEYDAYDLDSYFEMNSGFYNTFDSWQWAVSAAWYPADDHEVLLQISNSPYSFGETGLFGYALGWRGAWDFYESYWTANLWQYSSESYAKSLNLGNRFTFGNFSVDLDLMGRFCDIEAPYSGFTAMLAPSYEISDWGRVFAKFGWENGYDEDYMFYGAVFEYFPLKDTRDVRLHTSWSSNSFGDNFINVGVTWKFDMTSAVKYLTGRKDR
jgi:hypothetical protein